MTIDELRELDFEIDYSMPIDQCPTCKGYMDGCTCGGWEARMAARRKPLDDRANAIRAFPVLLKMAELVRRVATKEARLDGGPAQTLIGIEYDARALMAEMEEL